MPSHKITIRFNVGDTSLSMDEIDNRLYEAGFDDGFVTHNGKSLVSISVERDSSSKSELEGCLKKILITIFPRVIWL
jgi:hypothetical protein